MSDGNGGNGDWVQDGEDYIYRGEGAASPPPVPGQPPTPPPAGPPTAPQYGTPAPPPGAPPATPQYGAPAPPPYGAPAPPPGAAVPPPAMAGGPKKKRWPWIVAGALLFCGLPLAGCVALVGFGVSEISGVNDEIRVSTDVFVEEWNGGSPTTSIEARCFQDGDFPPIDWLVPGATELDWEEESIAFVKRSGNTTFASNADADTSTIDGFEDGNNAFVNAEFTDLNGAGSANVQLLFVNVNDDERWELCGISQN